MVRGTLGFVLQAADIGLGALPAKLRQQIEDFVDDANPGSKLRLKPEQLDARERHPVHAYAESTARCVSLRVRRCSAKSIARKRRSDGTAPNERHAMRSARPAPVPRHTVKLLTPRVFSEKPSIRTTRSVSRATDAASAVSVPAEGSPSPT